MALTLGAPQALQLAAAGALKSVQATQAHSTPMPCTRQGALVLGTSWTMTSLLPALKLSTTVNTTPGGSTT